MNKKVTLSIICIALFVALCAVIFAFTDAKDGAEDNYKEETKMTSTLSNTYYRLTVDKELNVAFLGGSITGGGRASDPSKNYVSRTENWLNENFPEATVNINNAGVSNTGSNYGIFRLDEDVLDIFVPDLIFIEYTSNDWARFGELNISRQNESLIRRLYNINPKIDIVFLFTSFVYESPSRNASYALAEHYGLITIDPGKTLKTMIDYNEGGDYSKYTEDKIHPNDAGFALYSALISETFKKHLVENAPENAELIDVKVPEPLNKTGLFLSPKTLGCELFPCSDLFSTVEEPVFSGKRRYDSYVETNTVGAEYQFTFDGTGFGLLVLKSPTVSNISYSVDGGEFKHYDIGDSQNYDHTQLYIMEYDLPKGEHTVTIKNEESQYGTTLRILQICINE